MSSILKPKFEQYRAELMKKSATMREREIVPRQAALVAALDTLPDLLVEKVRRLPRPDGMLEISARFVGLDADPNQVVKNLKKSFPESALGLPEANFWVGESDECVLVMFAGIEEGRYLTGRMLVNF